MNEFHKAYFLLKNEHLFKIKLINFVLFLINYDKKFWIVRISVRFHML